MDFATNRQINFDIRFAGRARPARAHRFHRVQIALQIGLVIIAVNKLFMI